MEPTRQQIVDDVIHDAHDGADRIVSAQVAQRVVDDLERLEGGGHRWVAELLRRWTIVGAQKACADWRRRHSHAGRTSKGTEVEVPVYGAVRETGDDGEIVYVQLPLFTMTLDQVRQRRDTLARQRDTLSAEVRFFTDLADVMEADPSLLTAGDALARLDAA